MRFDDMLATLLVQALSTPSARAAAWRQIVDVLAQGRTGSGELLDLAYDRLRELRPDVPASAFAETVLALAGRRLPPALFALFAEDAPSLISPLIAEAVLDEEEWLDLLPTLSPTARGLLRHRRDLPRRVIHALRSFGPSDFVISPPEHVFVADAEDDPPEVDDASSGDPVDPDPLPPEIPAAPESPVIEGERQIKDLLSRIAAFRARGPRPLASEPTPPGEQAIEEFRFETAADGVVIWVDGAPRGPLIGETIAVAANGDHGVDGHAAGAYRRRAPFRDARLTVAGDGPVAGEWRISAVPFFEPRDGRFTGYRGTARRPRADETAVTPTAGAGGVFGMGIEPDSISQLVHELRTPLNAILGFSEMIERQYRGPASSDYRAKAADIVAQGRRMLAAVDDLDIAAKVESRRIAVDEGAVDAADLLTRLHADYLPVAQARGVDLSFRIATDLPPAGTDPVALERMFARLLAATIALAVPEETVAAELTREGELGLRLAVARPRLLAGRDELTLLDPGYNPEGDWPDAPVLGLGFALRLVRNLAIAAGGRLDIEEEHFVLHLPLRHAAPQAGEGSA